MDTIRILKFKIDVWWVILATGFFILNSLTYLHSDDLSRANVDVLAHGNLLRMLYDDYRFVTGRIFAQFLVYILLSKSYAFFTVPIINIFNTFFSVMFLYNIYVFNYKLSSKCFGKECYNIRNLFFTLSFLFFITIYSDWFDLFLHKTMVIQYIWGYSLIIFLANKYDEFSESMNLKTTIVSLFIGIILGDYNELLSSAILCYLIVLFVKQFFKLSNEKRVIRDFFTTKQFYFFLGVLLSTSFMLLSPGSRVRKLNSINNLDVNYKQVFINSYSEKIIEAFHKYFYTGHHKVDILFINLVLVVVLSVLCITLNSRKIKQHLFLQLKYLLFFIFNIFIFVPFAWCYEGVIYGRVTIITDIILRRLSSPVRHFFVKRI